MGDYLTKGTTYSDGGIVNAANLNAHVDDAVFKYTAINSRTDQPAPGGAVEFLINDTSTLKKLSLTNLITTILGSYASFPNGFIIQTVSGTNTASTNLIGTIPIDDTVPAFGEGDDVGFIDITPYSTSNQVLFRFQCYAATSASNEFVTAAVFRGSTCIRAESLQSYNGTSSVVKIALEVLDSPASVVSQRYTVRMGTSGAGHYRINGFSNGRKFGGVSAATFIAHEIKR